MQETIRPVEPAEAAVRRNSTQWKIVSLNNELTVVFPDMENPPAEPPEQSAQPESTV